MSIYLTGDTHGDFTRLSKKNFPEQKDLTREDYVIVTGDLGLLWKEDKTYKYWLDFLNSRNFTVLWVDGNHESFSMLKEFQEEEWNGGAVRKISDNIIYLGRGKVFEIEDKTFFTFGGARSIDRGHRIPYVSWWPEEEATYADCQEAENNLERYNYNVDYIITHAIFPELITPMFHKYNLKNMPQYSGASEKYLSNVYRNVEFKHWYFGHYHYDIDYGKFHCLYNRIVKLEDD